MNDRNNKPGTGPSMDYRQPRAGLQDAIMNGVLRNDKQKKAWKKKEKKIMFIYVGAITILLLLLFFMKGIQLLFNGQ